MSDEKRLVVVDDEVHIRALLEQTLEELTDDFGVEVFSAADGAAGLDLIREVRPQLVFLDVMMPKMNGYEVCQAVTADPALAGVKVILLTAKGQEADRSQGLEAGAAHYLTKPFDPDEVLTVARDILGLGG
jgi:DNA-binding response OmpR family regulator